MNNKVIIHGHFYQPPRANPYIDSIERQKSAHPFHDWNERITSECYKPNAFSKILDRSSKIKNVVNNYEYLSFNIGPTLIDYLSAKYPSVVRQMIDGDKKSAARP